MKNLFTKLHPGTLAAAMILMLSQGASAQNERNAGTTADENSRLGSPISVMPPGPSPCGRVNMLNSLRITDTEATLTWNNAATADSFRVVCTQESNGLSQTRTISGINHYATFSGLLPNENYKWFVLSFCQGAGTPSGVMKFTTQPPARLQGYIRNPSLTPICPGLGTVTIPDIGYDKAIIDWTSRATYDSVQVRFNVTGSHIIKTITIPGTPANSRYVLAGLSELTTYDVSVSAFCNNGIQSSWSNTLNFTTLRAPGPRFQGLGSEFSIRLLPNPATTETRVIIQSSGTGNCQLTVFDITGKEKLNRDVELSETTQDIELDLTSLPKGIYLVKVKNNSRSSVQRLIIN